MAQGSELAVDRRLGRTGIVALLSVTADYEAFDLIEAHAAKEFDQRPLGLALAADRRVLVPEMTSLDHEVLAAGIGEPRQILRCSGRQGQRQLSAFRQVE